MKTTNLIARSLLIGATVMAVLPAAHAAADDDCGTRATTIIRNAYPNAKPAGEGFTVGGATIALPNPQTMGTDPHAVICRVWPAHPELTLAAVPLITRASDSDNDGDLELLVLDSGSLKVTQRLRLAGRMSDDAIGIRGIALDTARYQIAPGKTAFGLRQTKEGSSRANPYEEVDLWLYAIDGNQIKPVLDGIVVKKSGGEWDTNCAGAFNDVQRTLAMDSASHNGRADIVVTEKVSSTTAVAGKNGQCDERPGKTARSTLRLVYGGTQYDVPKALKPIE